jgi:hypothetical protein
MKHALTLFTALLLAPLAALRAPDIPTPPPENRRPENFQPFHYEKTTEQLMEKFSADQMKRAEAEFQEIAKVNEKGPWKPTWESLDQHNPPEWFLDAKLGIMLKWASLRSGLGFQEGQGRHVSRCLR